MQHADHHPAVQQALELLTDAVARGEARPRELAYLTDRVRVNERREQLFGTQKLRVSTAVRVEGQR